MKILFDGCDFSSRTGPNTFASRLAMQLFCTGYIIADPDDCDVVLAFIEPRFPIDQYRVPVVQRLDGIWFKDEHEFLTKNVRIKDCYENAEHVIWQSNFDREMSIKWWGEPRGGTVVHNGIKIDPLIDHSKLSPDLAKIRADHDKVFVCSSNWHGQKRLKQNVELFRHLKTIYSRSCLIVLGSNPEMFPGTDIFYAGNVSHEICNQVYAISDYMLHLSWLDHCPNVVIECIMQGTPVICSEAGGTKEIVKDFGLILKEDKKYDYELTNYDDPPMIDITQVKSLPDVTSLGSHLNIDIANVGRQYVEILEKVARMG